MENKNILFEDIRILKNDINDLRKNLNHIDKQKETFFDKKEEYGNEIRRLIKKIKKDKAKRDELTKKVKEDKKKRDALNKEIKDKISKIKNLKKEEGLIANNSKTESPSKIKEAIEKLELSIETEAMSFENEKKVMKRIKGLKKRFNEAKIINDMLDNFKKISWDIDEYKKNADDIHLRIQNRAKESQKLHESLVASSKEVDKLEVEEEKTFGKVVEFKKKFNAVNNLLKEKLTKMGELMGKLESFKLKKEEEKKLKDEFFIKNKEARIEEKIKKGEKLTTEDLLVFQSAKNKDGFRL